MRRYGDNPNLRQQIVNYTASCHRCQVAKPRYKPKLHRLGLVDRPSCPLHSFTMDIAGVYQTPRVLRNKCILIIIDDFSKFCWAEVFERPPNTELVMDFLL